MRAEYDPMNEPDVRAAAEEWTPPLDFTGMLQHQVGFSAVMMSARLLWPPFVEERGCVLLPWVNAEAGVAAWWKPAAGDTTHTDTAQIDTAQIDTAQIESAQIESALNHLHLWDLFPGAPEAGLVVLGETLVQTWRAALATQFPGRDFEVSFRNDEFDYGPTVYLYSC